MNEERLQIFEKYIHTNACSDECGWFAFFTPNGTIDDLPDWRVNGCDTEEEAIRELVKLAATALQEKTTRKSFYESLPNRNGIIDQMTDGVCMDKWRVQCFKCGVSLIGWVTYQDASIWFTEHLEDGCKTKAVLKQK